jgi:hypothetical protein
MPADTYGLSSTSIFWVVEETEVNQSGTDFVTISCVGWVRENGATLATALDLVPATLPEGDTGPVKSAIGLYGAALDTRSSRFNGDGVIEVSATYKIPLSQVFNPSGTQGDESSSGSDRYELRVELVDAPLMTHPCALAFDRVNKIRLKNLIEGDIIGNDDEDWSPSANPELEFRREVDNVPVEFSDTTVEVDGIEASPLDFARMIVAGIENYQRPAVRWVWTAARLEPPTAAELNRVGDVSDPIKAPKVTGRQWIYAGCNDSQEANTNAHVTVREFILSERGGVLKQLYKGGTGDINEND